MKNKIGLIVVVVLIIIFSVISFNWIKHRMEYAITDAVFVESEKLAYLSFKRVAGRITKLHKNEGDYVKAGEIIAEIDSTDYKLQLERINSEIKSLNYKEKSLKEKLKRIKKQLNKKVEIAKLTEKKALKEIQSIKLKIEKIDLKLVQLKKDHARFKNLSERDLIPKRKLEEIETELKITLKGKEELKTALQKIKLMKTIAEKKLKQAEFEKIKIRELEKEILALREKIKSLEKQKQDVQNLIRYTKLKAPFDGKIAKRFRTIGENVASGLPVYALVSTEDIYINVLLEETKLKGIKVGNKAKIKIDAYPNEKFEGYVAEIYPTSASKFALVPRDITAGEFTKVAQRIPVKIKITKGNKKLLRIGMSGEVEIKKSK
ncbi:HlyD family secretion protein [Persephonella sp.]